MPEVRRDRPDAGAAVQPDVQDHRRAGRHGRRLGAGLPAARDGAGDLRQLRQRARHHAPQAPVRRRADRQGVPQRDHARQLHLPDARVRADGDRVLRQAGRRRGGAPGLDRRAHAVVRRPRHAAREPAPARADEGRAGALRQALRRSRVPLPDGVERARGDRQPDRLRPQGAQPQPGEPRRGRRAALLRSGAEEAHRPVRHRAVGRAPIGRRWRSCATPTTSRWSRSRRPRRPPSCASWWRASPSRSTSAIRSRWSRRPRSAWSRRPRRSPPALPGSLPELLALSDDADANRIEVFKKVRGAAEKLGEEHTRTVLRLHPRLSPITVAVFPLKKNEPRLVELARGIKRDLQARRAAHGLRRHGRHREALPSAGRESGRRSASPSTSRAWTTRRSPSAIATPWGRSGWGSRSSGRRCGPRSNLGSNQRSDGRPAGRSDGVRRLQEAGRSVDGRPASVLGRKRSNSGEENLPWRAVTG